MSLGGALLIVVIAGVIYVKTPNPNRVDVNVSPTPQATITTSVSPTVTPYQTALGLTISSPLPNQTISSPLTIIGIAPGNWFFEGSAPIKLIDEKGKTVATGNIQANGDWMTSNPVNFSGSLTFKKPNTIKGNLVLAKDNPSGRPENNQEVSIPVHF